MSDSGEKGKVTRAAGVVGAATLVSRIGGYLREMVVAYYFDTGASADAFFVAFRIPNLLRRLFAEGTLTIAFVPVFTEVLRKKGRQEAVLLARSTGSLLALSLILVCAAGVAFAPQVLRVIAPGFDPGGETYALAMPLTRWCFPFLFFISLVALAAGVLNSLGHFFAPAAAPALLNLAIIAAAVGLTPHLDPPVMALAMGVLLGGVAQLMLQVPYLRRHQVPLKPAWRLNDPALRRVLRLMGPAAFGAAVYQLSVLINTALASKVGPGAVSFLNYADRLVQFPLGIFAIAVGTAILPSLSRQAADDDTAGLLDTMGFGIRLTLFINLPAAVGIAVLAQPLVELLFVRGRFDLASAAATAGAAMGYAAGLWAFACIRPVVSAFYALKNTLTPVLVAAVALIVNLAAALALMGPLAHSGLALASSLAGMVNLAGLLLLLRLRLGALGGRRLLKATALMALATAVMALAAAGVAYLPSWGPARGLESRLVRPLAAVVAGTVVYLLMARLLRLPELDHLLSTLRRKAGRG